MSTQSFYDPRPELGRMKSELAVVKEEAAQAKSTAEAAAKVSNEAWNKSYEPGESIDSYGARDTIGAQITSNYEGLELLANHGKSIFEVQGQLFRPSSSLSTITSDGLGYGSPGIMPAQQGGFLGPMAWPWNVLRLVLPSRPVESGQFHFMKQTAKAAASPQVEGSGKFETTSTWTAVASAIATVAVYLSVTRQALEDIPYFRRILDVDLLLAVAAKEQAEMLTGSGTGVHLEGLVTAATSFDTGRIQSGDTRLDYLRHACSQLEEIDERPTFIALNPQDFWQIRGLKDQADNAGGYLMPISTRDGGDFWLQTVRTTGVTAGTFLVGCRDRAEILDRTPTRVMISFEHGDNFVENVATILCESRVGLAIYSASGFVTGSFSGASPL